MKPEYNGNLALTILDDYMPIMIFMNQNTDHIIKYGST